MWRVTCPSCSIAVVNDYPCHEQGCHDHALFKRGGKTYLLFQVWTLDSWGNSKDGFEVNDRSKATKVMLSPDSSDRTLLKKLKAAGLLNKFTHFESYTLDWPDESTCFIEWKKTGEPLFQLEAL